MAQPGSKAGVTDEWVSALRKVVACPFAVAAASGHRAGSSVVSRSRLKVYVFVLQTGSSLMGVSRWIVENWPMSDRAAERYANRIERRFGTDIRESGELPPAPQCGCGAKLLSRSCRRCGRNAREAQRG